MSFRTNGVARAIALCGALLLAACAGSAPVGAPANGFAFPAVARVYIPLASSGIFGGRFGVAVRIAPGVAATNAHNANLLARDAIIGRVPDEDLLFFRDPGMDVLPQGEPYPGETVVAYGQGARGALRMVSGAVHRLGPNAFTYTADGGQGFSGGPVLDAKTGALLGITYGYLDVENGGRKIRLMIAYRAAFAGRELRRVLHTAGHSEN